MDSNAIIIAIVSATGSLLVSTILGIAIFFLKRYIASQDSKNAIFFKKFEDAFDKITKQANINDNHLTTCNFQMQAVGKELKEHKDVIIDHETRIEKIEHKI